MPDDYRHFMLALSTHAMGVSLGTVLSIYNEGADMHFNNNALENVRMIHGKYHYSSLFDYPEEEEEEILNEGFWTGNESDLHIIRMILIATCIIEVWASAFLFINAWIERRRPRNILQMATVWFFLNIVHTLILFFTNYVFVSPKKNPELRKFMKQFIIHHLMLVMSIMFTRKPHIEEILMADW